jgi:hypothetical protein
MTQSDIILLIVFVVGLPLAIHLEDKLDKFRTREKVKVKRKPYDKI